MYTYICIYIKTRETSYGRDFSGGMQYDATGAACYLKKHPAGSKAYPSVADGRRRGAVKHGLVAWAPWMPAWEVCVCQGGRMREAAGGGGTGVEGFREGRVLRLCVMCVCA